MACLELGIEFLFKDQQEILARRDRVLREATEVIDNLWLKYSETPTTEVEEENKNPNLSK